jgi:nucleotide-binding universal stress UspA family protein
VLVALDGSPAAATALPAARAIAQQLQATVEIVHVAPEEVAPTELGGRLGLVHPEDETVPVRLLIGEPVEQLLRAADDRSVRFLVLATHGRRLENERPLAGIPEAVAAHAKQPTLLVRPEAAATGETYPLKRLLLPFDGTAGTARALRSALILAGDLGASIDVLYVVHLGQELPAEPEMMMPPRYVDHPHYEWSGWADEVRSWLRACCGDVAEGVPMHVYVRASDGKGDIGVTVAAFADEGEADTIVLVRRSHLEAGRAETLRAVFNLTPCPVLLVAGKPFRPPRNRESQNASGAGT